MDQSGLPDLVVVDGATHAGRVDNEQSAALTSVAVLRVVQAVRTGKAL